MQSDQCKQLYNQMIENSKSPLGPAFVHSITMWDTRYENDLMIFYIFLCYIFLKHLFLYYFACFYVNFFTFNINCFLEFLVSWVFIAWWKIVKQEFLRNQKTLLCWNIVCGYAHAHDIWNTNQSIRKGILFLRKFHLFIKYYFWSFLFNDSWSVTKQNQKSKTKKQKTKTFWCCLQGLAGPRDIKGT